jgi:hypothetical protein
MTATEEQPGDVPEKRNAAGPAQNRHENPTPVQREPIVNRILCEFVEQGYSSERVAEGLKADGTPLV